MLKAAGFHEDAESFFMLEANLLRLRRVHGELRKQLQQALHLMSWEVMLSGQVESCIGYRSASWTG